MTTLLKKAGRVTIGLPVAAANAVMERVTTLRSQLEEASDQVSDRLRKDFDSWADEGERLINRLNEQLDQARSGLDERAMKMRSEVRETVDKTMDTASDTAAGVRTAATTVYVELESVSGIGPATATSLRKAGVLSASALLERTSTKAETERLAHQTEIAASKLAGWADQVRLTDIDGIGPEYQRLLNAAGIATKADLAAATPAALVRKMEATDLGDQTPAVDTVKGWIYSARA